MIWPCFPIGELSISLLLVNYKIVLQNFMSTKKFASLFVALAIVLALVGGVSTASAQTVAATATDVSALQALIASLQAQITALTGGAAAPASTSFTRDLTIGSRGDDVSALQTLLESRGMLMMPAGVAKGYFGALTKSALAKYQASVGLPATGYFGPLTRGQIASSGTSVPTVPGTPVPGTPTTPGTLQGGAGSVDSYDLVSGLNNEEVGEDEEGVEVAGLEIEADEGSDLNFTAVRLVFDEGTAGSDFEDYATEVAVLFDGKQVASVDADEFNDDNAWTKTISLNGAVLKAGDTAELVVAVSGASNLDTNDAADTWTVDFRQVRFEDATGASISEDPTTGTRTFSFESFATAADTEFKISEGDDSINDSHILVVDSSNDTDDEPILSYNVEIEGDASVHVDALPVGVVVTTQDHVDQMVSRFTLWMDGEEVGSANMSDAIDDADGVEVGTFEAFLFDDLDLTLEGGEEYEFVVKADLYPTVGTGDLAEGDTIAASTTATMLELGSAYADIEDESGEDLAAADISGSASSDASTVYVSGISVAYVSSNATKTVGSIAGDPDVAELTLVFDVTAIGDEDVWVERDFAASGATASASVDGQFWATTTDSTTGTSTSGFTAIGTPTLSASGSSSNDDTAGADQDFKINSGDTRRFTFMISIPAGGDNVNVGARITGIKWGTADDDDNMNNVYTSNLSDLKTTTITGLIIH